MDVDLDRALALAIGTRKDRIRAEKTLATLRIKEERAADELAALVAKRSTP